MDVERRVGTSEGADADLDFLFGQLDQLLRLAKNPDAASDGDQRYDLSIRWGVLLSGRLQRVLHYARRGELTVNEQERFVELCSRLRDAAPVARALGVADPTQILDR